MIRESWRRARKCLLQFKALRHRRRLGKNVPDQQWIAVTGSCGKSSTARLLSQVLSAEGECSPPNENWNYTGTVPLAILQVKASQRFVVQEVATHLPGTIKRLCRLVQPRVGIVMNVGTDHYSSFKSIENIAVEKADLVRALPSDGIAVLNADDPNVLAMAAASRARVVTFGLSEGADFRAENVRSRWPEPLSFALVHGGTKHDVVTRLHGRHLAPNVLAGLAAAHAAGMPLAKAVRAVRDVEPVSGRMSELRSPDGVAFIRDDFKAPWWGIPLTLEFLADASAGRKIAVLGAMSDNPGNKGRKFRRLIAMAAEIADVVVLVGEAAGELNEQLRGVPKIKPMPDIAAARTFLDDFLRRGDLVLLKGMLADHLERLAWARSREVGCWRARCGRKIQCSACEFLRTVAEPNEPIPH